MTSNPTDICGAPINIGLRLYIEDHLVGECGLCEIATSGVEDSLWLRSGARCVENKEDMLCIKGLSYMLI